MGAIAFLPNVQGELYIRIMYDKPSYPYHRNIRSERGLEKRVGLESHVALDPYRLLLYPNIVFLFASLLRSTSLLHPVVPLWLCSTELLSP